MKFTASVCLIRASPPQKAYTHLYQNALLSYSFEKIYEKVSVLICKEECWSMTSVTCLDSPHQCRAERKGIAQMAMFDCPSPAS